MGAELSGQVTKFFIFDVAESFDLAALRTLSPSPVPARVASRKPPTPSYVQYRHPPVSFDGTSIGVTTASGFTVRFKVFHYGAVSVALSRPLPGTWEQLLEDGVRWHDDPGLAADAEAACRSLIARVPAALTRPRTEFLSEDYLVFSVTGLPEATTADALLKTRGSTIAQLLRGEREELSHDEREEVLRHRLSYFSTDLVVPTWNAAFIYDTEAGAQDVAEILEFANSQLLEFRYYDELLDEELRRIYALLERPRWPQSWFGRRFTRAARHVHALFIDVNELTDRTENALKIAGDVYAARLFSLAAARLGLDHWKGNVRDKLKTLDDIYRFAVEQTGMARGELLELVIVLILVLELGLFFAGVMR
jgi:hypothetical protein